MTISVIIPTFNGARKIVGLLKALEEQTLMADEVVVVIDGSTDETKAILESSTFNIKKLSVIVQDNKGRSIARNNGVKNASGELLIFFDDDMRPAPDCIAEHVEHHLRYPGTILTGSAIDEENDNKSDIQLYRAFLSRKWSMPLQGLAGKPLPRENIFVTAANFSISKKLFLELKGFDEALNDAEDFDLAVKAFNNNVPLYYKHEAFAIHDDSFTCASYIKRHREYQQAHSKLRKIKPLMYSKFNLREIKQPAWYKSVIYRLFAFRFWLWTVDSFNWLKLLPKKLRYRIYDLIITANGIYYPEKIKL